MIHVVKPCHVLIVAVLAGACADGASADGAFITLNDGHAMPRINLGTCCGSQPSVGVVPWLAAGGVGIDTAVSYKDSPDIAAGVATAGVDRSKLFITTKIMAGNGDAPHDCAADPDVALLAVKGALVDLNTSYLDLVLMHRPCQQSGLVCEWRYPTRTQVCNQTAPPRFPGPADPAAANGKLWQGLIAAQKQGLVRSIGVSNFGAAEIAALPSVVPAVNQIEHSPMGWDASTVASCLAAGIVVEAYSTLKGCPFDADAVKSPAATYNKTAAQVCLRWAVQRAGALASGTGSDDKTVRQYTEENLDIFDFKLTDAEMLALDTYQAGHSLTN
eukprot:g607.t1